MRTDRPHRAKPRHIRRFRLRLDALEDRTLPAVVFWNVDADGFWDVPGNWNTGMVPGPNDDAVIDRAVPVTVTHRTGSDTVHSVTGRDQLTVTSSTLTVTGSVD